MEFSVLVAKARMDSPFPHPTLQPSLRRMPGKFWGIFSDPDCGTKAFQEPILHDILPGQDGDCINL